MKILLTGGGTGGHIYPAIAIAERAIAAGDTVAYIGMRGGLEERLVPHAGLALTSVRAAPLARKNPAAIVRTVGENAAGVRAAAAAIAAFAPDAIIATGGYVSLPVMLAAAWYRRTQRARRIVLGLLEPNAVAGLTNRLLAPLVDEIWGAYSGGAGRFRQRFVQTGVPVRAAFLHPPDKNTAKRQLGLDPDRPSILVIGGSQGARSINAAVAELAQSPAPANAQLLVVTGRGNDAAARDAMHAAIARGDVLVFDYLDDPLTAYAAADLVVARAGASTLAELAALHKAAILIPYPHATADHQRKNAEAHLADGGGANGRLIDDAVCDGQHLAAAIVTMLGDPSRHAPEGGMLNASATDAGGAVIERVRTLFARGSAAV